MSRPSVFLSTNSTTATSSTSNLKQRQANALSARLSELSQHMITLNALVQTTADQAESLRQLGGMHAAFFMGAAKVLTEEEVSASSTEPTS